MVDSTNTTIATSPYFAADEGMGHVIPFGSSELAGSGETLSELMGSIRPLAFQPELVPKVWGGYRLLEHAARNQRTKEFSSLVAGDEICRIGESWEISAVEGKSSRLVINRPSLSGRPKISTPEETWTLLELWQRYGASLAGAAWALQQSSDHPREFPWLVKHLECRDWLSLQVHPGSVLNCDAAVNAQLKLFNPESSLKEDSAGDRVKHPIAHAEQSGKFEFWLVVETSVDGEIIVGPVREDQREELARRVADGAREYELLDAGLLARFPLEVGQWAILPPGSVHTVRGVTILEVQTPVDVTYRIDDYGRRGSDGALRKLHPQEAADAIRSGTGLPNVSHAALWSADSLCSHERTMNVGQQITHPQDPFQICFQSIGIECQILSVEEMTAICVIEGQLELSWNDDAEVLSPRDIRLLPVELGEVSLRSKGDSVSILLLTPSWEGRCRPSPKVPR